MSDPRSLDSLLRDRSTLLGRLTAQADMAHRVNATLRKSIDAPWIDHVRFVKLRGNTAVLFVSSASALTALRFQRQPLLDAIRRELGPSCSQFETKIRPG